MDWEQLKERTLGEVGTAIVTEGGGVTAGFIGAGFIGRQVQNFIMRDENIAGNIVNGFAAWAGNNVPKLAVWYLTRKYALEPGEAATPWKEGFSDARKAFAGSVVFDTLMRLANAGTNPASASILGWQVLGSGQPPEIQKSAQADIQRLIQENSALRTELNKALQRLASQPVTPPGPVAPPAAPAIPTTPVVQQPVITQQAPPVVRYTEQPAVITQQTPPVVRYTPVTPYNVPPYGTPIPPYSAQTPVAKTEDIIRPAPVPPVTRPMEAEEIYTQPTPPAVQERQRRFGAMQHTPPHVQERQKRYGFMSGEEKDIAQVFGML